MQPLRPEWRRQFLLVIFVAALSSSISAQNSQLGNVKFETSGSEKAQASFLRGLAAPSHELHGEILLRAGRPRDAAEQFRIALLRQPNRARSLLGLGRAAAKSGDQPGATAAYAKLLEQWQQADEGLPELREAREYLKAKP